jgi:hypothetical protein
VEVMESKMEDKKFNLRERRVDIREIVDSDSFGFFEKDIKEFIKRREDVIQAFLKKEINCAKMWIELNKLVEGE